MKFEFLFVPDSAKVHQDRQFSAYEIDCSQQPYWLLVLPQWPRSQKPPEDFKVVPNVNAILEDIGHDWRWLPRTRKLRYCGHNISGAGRWIAVSFDKEWK